MKTNPYFSRRTLAAALAASSLGVAAAGAQSNTPDTARGAEHHQQARAQETPEPGSPERDFLRQASSTNYTEVAIARLALDKAEEPRVRELAQQIITDHEQAAQRLTQLAEAHGLELRVEGDGSLTDPAAPDENVGNVPPRVPGPGAPIPAPQSPGYGGFGSVGPTGADDITAGITGDDYRELEDASGQAFDSRFVELMEQSHEQALRRFRAAAEELDDAQLSAFARQQVPVLERHLEHTRQVSEAVAE